MHLSGYCPPADHTVIHHRADPAAAPARRCRRVADLPAVGDRIDCPDCFRSEGIGHDLACESCTARLLIAEAFVSIDIASIHGRWLSRAIRFLRKVLSHLHGSQPCTQIWHVP